MWYDCFCWAVEKHRSLARSLAHPSPTHTHSLTHSVGEWIQRWGACHSRGDRESGDPIGAIGTLLWRCVGGCYFFDDDDDDDDDDHDDMMIHVAIRETSQQRPPALPRKSTNGPGTRYPYEYHHLSGQDEQVHVGGGMFSLLLCLVGGCSDPVVLCFLCILCRACVLSIYGAWRYVNTDEQESSGACFRSEPQGSFPAGQECNVDGSEWWVFPTKLCVVGLLPMSP